MQFLQKISSYVSAEFKLRKNASFFGRHEILFGPKKTQVKSHGQKKVEYPNCTGFWSFKMRFCQSSLMKKRKG